MVNHTSAAAPRFELRRARVLQDERDPLPGAHAHAEDPVADLAQPQLGGEREHVAGAGRPERVADGDRAAVRVQPVVGHLEPVELAWQLAQYGERLRSVRLVDLPDVDVARGKA